MSASCCIEPTLCSVSIGDLIVSYSSSDLTESAGAVSFLTLYLPVDYFDGVRFEDESF